MGDDDVDWAEAMAAATPADCVPVEATDPLYILYTSGTTGKPKGVVRDGGGYAVALAWSMPNVYDVGAGETIFTGVRRRLGRRALLHRLRAAAGRGHDRALRGQAGRHAGRRAVLAGRRRARREEHVHRARRRSGRSRRRTRRASTRAKYDLSALRVPVPGRRAARPGDLPLGVGPAGHPGDRPLVADRDRLADRRQPGRHRAAADQARLADPAAARLGRAGPRRRREAGRADGTDGAIVVKLPMPPGSLPTLWNDDERFVSSYMSAFDGYYLTGDGGRIDDDGYVFVMGRTDDVINVAGHRLSTGGMEEVLASHPDVAECAVIGVADPMKGQVPRGFVVLKAGVDRDEDELRAELVQLVRDQVGAVASLKDVAVVAALPKTRSGKILRKTMRGIADGADEPVPSTIDDADVLDALRPVLRREALTSSAIERRPDAAGRRSAPYFWLDGRSSNGRRA